MSATTRRLREFDPHAPSHLLALPRETPKFAPATALYRFYDSRQRLLYIGVAGQPRERWSRHRREAPWWPDVAYVAVETHPDLHAALDHERQAIHTEDPKFNKRSKKGGN